MSLTAACGGSAGDAAPVPNDAGRVPLTIALSSFSIGQALNFVALDGGFFEEQNLEVELLNSKTGTAAVQTVISGDADFASANLETALKSTAQGQKIFVPLRLLAGQPGSLVVSDEFAAQTGLPPSAPVAERLRALDGAVLASQSPTTSYTVLIQRTTAEVGVTPSLTFLASETMPAVLSQNQIDGYIASSPYTDQAVQRGDGVVWINGPAGEWPGTSAEDFIVPLAVGSELVESSPDVVTRVIAAYLAASNLVESDPDRALELIAQRFPDQEPELLAAIWEANRSEFVKPIPTPEDIASTQRQMTGELSEQVKTIDPETLLLPDLVADAQQLAGTS